MSDFCGQTTLCRSHATIGESEDTKGVIIIHISKKNIQHNDQNNKEQKSKQRSTKHAHKAKDRVTRTPLKTGGRVSSSCSTCGSHRVNLVTKRDKRTNNNLQNTT